MGLDVVDHKSYGIYQRCQFSTEVVVGFCMENGISFILMEVNGDHEP